MAFAFKIAELNKIPALIVPVGAAALVAGLDSISFAIALASLLFSGELAGGLNIGITALLAGSIILSLVLGVLSQFRNNVAGVQDIGVAILAAALAGLVAGLAPVARLPTAFAIIATSSVATGVLMVVVGLLRAGRVVRYFPLEVLAGFMAATGFLLLIGGVAIATNVTADIHGMMAVNTATQFAHLAPAIGLAVLIALAVQRFSKPHVLLSVLMSVICLFHISRWWLGVDMDQATDAGWLPRISDVSGAGFDLHFLVGAVDWPTVVSSASTIAAVAVISLFACLLNVSALEFVAGEDIDLDREMRLTGGANILVGGFAGPPGYTDFTISQLFHKLGLSSRGLGFAIALVQVIGLLYATSIAKAVPTFVSSGLVLYLGYGLVRDWLVNTRKSYSTREWLVVALIVLVSVLHSFLLAIFVGLLVATLLFAYSYANAPVVRASTDLAHLSSTMERPARDALLLAKTGHAVKILRLHGYLFFGTSEQVMAQIHHATKTLDGLRAVIIDFSEVTEMDSASANTFRRVIELARRQGFTVTFCGCNVSVSRTMRRTAIEADSDVVLFAPDLDRALIQSEQIMLGQGPASEAGAVDLVAHFAKVPHENDRIAQLFAMMKRKIHEPGATIVQGTTGGKEVFFLESGSAVVQRPSAYGSVKRLRTMLPGAIIGDVAYSLDAVRTADILAETRATTLSISAKDVAVLEKTNPQLALLFKSLLNHALAEKVVTSDRMTEHTS